jgi:hypothetical protein
LLLIKIDDAKKIIAIVMYLQRQKIFCNANIFSAKMPKKLAKLFPYAFVDGL